MAARNIRLSQHYGSFNKTGEVYDIIFERLLEHPVKKVWEAITRPEQLAQWLGATEVNLSIGGDITIQLLMAKVVGKIIALEPERLLEYTWGSESHPELLSIVRWELFEEGNGRCRLVFRERLVDRTYLVDVGPGWHWYIDALCTLLDGNQPPAWSAEAWEETAAQATERYKAILQETDEGQHRLPDPAAKASLLIRKPAAEVFEALVNPEITSKFWYSKGSARLEAGKAVQWEWEDFNYKAEVWANQVIPDRFISFVWPGGGKETIVNVSFEPHGPAATYVTITEKGWDPADKNLPAYLTGQTEGWTLVLAGMKAYLEHGLRLQLVEDKYPDKVLPAL
jgi:uncharacterized protein YndB with AHSA1/START domain